MKVDHLAPMSQDTAEQRMTVNWCNVPLGKEEINDRVWMLLPNLQYVYKVSQFESVLNEFKMVWFWIHLFSY